MIKKHSEKSIPDKNNKLILEKVLLIHKGMNIHSYLRFSLLGNNKHDYLIGRTVFIDYMQKEFRIMDSKNTLHFVSFSSLVDVERV